MKKTFIWTAFLAAAVLVCAASTAPAQNFDPKSHLKLYPPTGSDFPAASGSVSGISNTVWWQFTITGFSVSKLAPNTSYVWTVEFEDIFSGELQQFGFGFQTDGQGRFKSSGSFSLGRGWLPSGPIEVYDSGTGRLVLSSAP